MGPEWRETLEFSGLRITAWVGRRGCGVRAPQGVLLTELVPDSMWKREKEAVRVSPPYLPGRMGWVVVV